MIKQHVNAMKTAVFKVTTMQLIGPSAIGDPCALRTGCCMEWRCYQWCCFPKLWLIQLRKTRNTIWSLWTQQSHVHKVNFIPIYPQCFVSIPTVEWSLHLGSQSHTQRLREFIINRQSPPARRELIPFRKRTQRNGDDVGRCLSYFSYYLEIFEV